ncbi:MAG: ribokinase [Dehalococcoidia bacterium]|nr:MAG: ribokinase [Dehalococcoidia bacterium]
MRDVLRQLATCLPGHRVLVVGDVCLDEYLIGRPERLSREAPVPVLAFQRREVVPGAAANPARNIHALGSTASLVGVIGDDPSGEELRCALATAGIDTSGLLVDPHRPTSVKTRVVADAELRVMQQLVRIDRGTRAPLAPPLQAALLAVVERLIPSVDVVLVSDYRAGVLTAETIATLAALAAQHQVPLAVDSQGDLWRFRGYTLVRSNRPDAEATLQRPLLTDEDFARATAELREALGAQALVITRGAAGIAARGPQGFATFPAANRSEVFDAVGAGDTVIAVLALALAAGSDVLPAAQLANVAAGIVVRRFGNAVTTVAELLAALEGAQRTN